MILRSEIQDPKGYPASQFQVSGKQSCPRASRQAGLERQADIQKKARDKNLDFLKGQRQRQVPGPKNWSFTSLEPSRIQQGWRVQ